MHGWGKPIGTSLQTYTIHKHNTANSLHHRVNQVQHWPGKGDASAEHLLAELGQLSLNTLTQKGKTEGVNRPSRRCLWYLLLGGSTWLKSTVLTVWMKVSGVTQPGTGTWSPEDQSPSWLGHLTTCVTENNNIKFNLRSKYKSPKYKKMCKKKSYSY